MDMCSGPFKEHRPSLEVLEADTQPPKQSTCPVNGCGKLFSNSSHLTLHKAKVHGIDLDQLKPQDKSVIPSHYHCPVYGCYFHTHRYFANYKLLKRHYRGIHGDKAFLCSKCQKGFALGHACKRHEASCGVIYHCNTCSCPYTTREALYMHCTRQQHELPDEVKATMKKYSSNKPTPSHSRQATSVPSHDVGTPLHSPQPCVIFVSRMEPQTDCYSGQRKILPKPVINSVIPMTRVTVGPDKISVEKLSLPSTQTAEMQTDIYDLSNPLEQTVNKKQENTNQILKNVTQASTGTQVSLGKSHKISPSLVRSSTGMQTNLSVLPKNKRHCAIAGTQTSGNDILKSAMACAEIPIHDYNGKNKTLKSPKSRLRVSKRQSMKTSEVQTRETFPPKKKRRRRISCRQAAHHSDQTIAGVNTVSLASHACTANPEQMMLDYVASISTQTQKSFLEESGHGRHESQAVQNSQTQTSLSTLFNDMRESFLSEENKSILTDLGIAFDDTPDKPCLGTGRGESMVTQCPPNSVESRTNPSLNQTRQKEDYLPVVESPSFLDLLCDDIPETVAQNDRFSPNSRDTSTLTGQEPLPKTASDNSDKDVYVSKYSSVAIDFGVQTNSYQERKDSDSDLEISKWNPCMASTVAKDMHTQTMVPRSSDFGVQTSQLHDVDFLVNPHMEVQSYMESQGQGPMLCDSAATDMHTQTVDDLLDFLMTNMETQTEDPFVYVLGLSDIETQTPAEVAAIDSVVTTETQTHLQSLVHEESDLTLSTDMQTQTQFAVVEFGANDFTDSHTQTNFDLFSL